jgi:phosphoribosylglycinamide formyltransferase-1
MKRPRIAILASGSGSTAEAFIRASATGEIAPTVDLIICSKSAEKAGIWQRTVNLNQEFGLNIPVKQISRATHPAKPDETLAPGAQTTAEETAILEQLLTGDFDLIALMGYMKKIGPRLVHEFGWRNSYVSPYEACMVNTHPGLLPSTKGLFGLGIQQFTLDNHRTRAGQTLHIVAEDYDDGPIIAEHRIDVAPNDTSETLFAHVQTIEKQFLPRDIANFIEKRQQYLQNQGG